MQRSLPSGVPTRRRWFPLLVAAGVTMGLAMPLRVTAAEDVPILGTEGQPLAANVERLLQTFSYLGHPLPQKTTTALRQAAKRRDPLRLQKLLDEHVLFVVTLNPEVRVKVARGPASANLQQFGYTPHLVKVLNHSTVTRQLRIDSPQGGAVFAGASDGSLRRQAQTELNRKENRDGASDRFLECEIYRGQPMTPRLSGLEVEYAIALLSSSEAGRREATIGFDVGSGTQDLGFRGEIPVLFDVQPAREVALTIHDFDGQPTTARLLFRDHAGHVYPSQVKRLAPDFFFQPQIYRADGETVLLPPGTFEVTYSRGPEYRPLQKQVVIPPAGSAQLTFDLERWVHPEALGFYSGDHHIHGAGCAHYDDPTQGVTPQDMFRQVKGEGLNVGCVLTWGPCFEFQRQYFSPIADTVSEPRTVLKYDLEISGFGSAALGHVCLLDLEDQTYPGSAGGKDKGWPTWTVPVMRWAKEQGGVTGYPHSAMHVNPPVAAQRLLETYDADGDQAASVAELQDALLPEPFARLDADRDGRLRERELTIAIERASQQLPNLVIPEMNGAGAMEICVSTAAGVCDFISAMDTARIPEWNTWYHLMNCGFPLKLSGETDFPCMSSRRVGQGRVYVRLGEQAELDFSEWCAGIRRGQSYVSDGFAHALQFAVAGTQPGDGGVRRDAPGTVTVQAEVSFAAVQPNAAAYGGITPADGRRMIGDTVDLHAPRDSGEVRGGTRLVELVVNGEAVASQQVPADGGSHQLAWEIPIEESSWVALRQFPQLHTNPVEVRIADQPIRASSDSARWCAASIRLLWKNRERFIAPPERAAAREAYDAALARYQTIGEEAVARGN